MSFFVSFIDDVVYGYRLKVHLVDVQVEQNSETIECYSMKGHTTAGMVFRAVFLLGSDSVFNAVSVWWITEYIRT